MFSNPVMISWFVAGGILLGIEMTTGTFYFLIVGFSMWAAALVAGFTDYGLDVQVILAAALTITGCAALEFFKRRFSSSQEADKPLDYGQVIQVTDWDGMPGKKVSYRGTTWDAKLAEPGLVSANGYYSIEDLDGNTLILKPFEN